VNSLRFLPAILLVLFLATSTASRAESAKSLRVQGDINAIDSSVKTYRLNCGELPPPEFGLHALVTRPKSLGPDKRWVKIADRIPIDPWNQPYRYVAGDGYPKGFGIYCCGKDGLSATQGNDPDDINSWRDPNEDLPDSPGVKKMKLSLAGGGLAAVSFYLGTLVARRGRVPIEA
jgi:general secretion pathway protein G